MCMQTLPKKDTGLVAQRREPLHCTVNVRTIGDCKRGFAVMSRMCTLDTQHRRDWAHWALARENREPMPRSFVDSASFSKFVTAHFILSTLNTPQTGLPKP